MDQLKNLKPEHKLLLAILGLGLVAGLYYFLVIMDIDEQLSGIGGRLKQLETDAEEAGVTILSYEPSSGEGMEFYDELPVDMEIRGTYVQLVRFLKLMAEPKKRLANVRDLQFAADRKRRSGGSKSVTPFGAAVVKSETMVTASFRVVTFVYTGGK